MRKDPDNISSLGRKIIFDALQVAEKLPNDNLKYIIGTADTYILDSEQFVKIRTLAIDELNGYATIPVEIIKNHEKRRTNKQGDKS